MLVKVDLIEESDGAVVRVFPTSHHSLYLSQSASNGRVVDGPHGGQIVFILVICHHAPLETLENNVFVITGTISTIGNHQSCKSC